MSAQPIVVAAAIIRDSDQFLVARRTATARRAGLWEFPGGKVEPGETLEQALRREIREELGIDVAVEGPTDVVHWEYPDISVELHAFACSIVTGTPVASEHAELAWCRARALAGLEWSPADVPIMRRIVSEALREEASTDYDLRQPDKSEDRDEHEIPERSE